ncbi:tetratricopeptide repeat protein [Streptomyces sp. KA12]|uniref:tetratricopeptide repeat protein n=1 Tax=Streptomyces sp. KA12 TaxID=2991730 RepID=UPI0023B09A04|nr:tetratricopeptide repeat protein [Streptomyces sp. KA12]MDF0374365.1 tetratricopeptide repeat protein [Streptomyces sp. KA12]
MDAADLDYRARTLTGCIPPLLVSRLLELGHDREVELQSGRGEWFCALEWARLLGQRGRREEALEVLAPYVATNWWPAAQARAELLEGWGRVEEAIATSRPYAEAGDRLALVFFARLLARHDRSGEAFMLLRDGIQDWFLAQCLVDVAEAAGMDEEAAALLEVRIEGAVPACDDPDCNNLRMEPSNAVDLLATIRERQGRIEEAITLLRTHETISVNGRAQLADLLARHDRVTELRAYAASEHHGHAAQRLAEVLEESGDAEGAIAAYRTFGATPSGMWHVAVPLSELLVRHGRGNEAIEVMRALAERPGGAEDWIVHTLCTLYADHGRPRDGLAYLDALRGRRGGREDWDFFRMRLPLMADCGLLDEAIEQARSHPEGDTWYAAWVLSDVLAEAGRAEEAAAVLARHPTFGGSLRAERLIDLGRIEDAVRLLQQPISKPTTSTWDGVYSTEPPF